MEEYRKSLGGNSVRRGVHPIVTANLVIPEDQDRETYIRHCFQTRTVMIRDVLGGTWTKCFVPKNNMEDLVFPPDSETLGSLVIANRVQKHNYPVVVAVLDLKNVATIVDNEYQFRKQKINSNGSSVDLFGDSEKLSLDFSVNSTEDDKGEINVSLSNPNSTAKMSVFVKGFIDIISEKDLSIKTNGNYNIRVSDSEDEEKANFQYNQDEGYKIIDEYGNEIITKDGEISIKENSGNVIKLSENLIEISKGGSTEFLVRGETLKSTLENLLDSINSLTVICGPTGSPSGPPLNSASFSALKVSLNNILSSKIKIE